MAMATKGITVSGWFLLGSAAVTFMASFMPWYTVSILGFTASANGWNSFWWLPTLIAIGTAAFYLVGVLNGPARGGIALPIAGLASFVLTLLVLIYILARGTNAVHLGSTMFGDAGLSAGPSIGLFVALLATAATAYFAAVVTQEGGTKLPFHVPGPR